MEDAGPGDDVALCNSNQFTVGCSQFEGFPNVGTSHCYTAAGRYKYHGSEFVNTGILRGCINCTGKNEFLKQGVDRTEAGMTEIWSASRTLNLTTRSLYIFGTKAEVLS